MKGKATILFKVEDDNENLWLEHFQATLSDRCPDFNFESFETIAGNQINIAKSINSSSAVCLLDTPSLQCALYDCRDWLSSYLCDNVCIVSICEDGDGIQLCLDDEFENYCRWRKFPLSDNVEANISAYDSIQKFLDDTLNPANKPKPKRRKPKPEVKGLPLPSAIEGKIECVFPLTICKDGINKQVFILFKTPMSADIKIEIGGTDIKFTKRNPYVVEFTAPDRKPGSASVKVYEAGKQLPDKWSLRYTSPNLEPLQCLASLMQSLDIQNDSMQELDRRLAKIFIESCPRDQLLQRFYDNNNFPTDPVSSYEFPTLLHFAAYHGLEELVATFINSPLGMEACHIKNRRQLDPAEIAESNGNDSLAQYIRDEMDVANVVDDYVNFQMRKIEILKDADEPYDDIRSYDSSKRSVDKKGYVQMTKPIVIGNDVYVKMQSQPDASTPGYIAMRSKAQAVLSGSSSNGTEEAVEGSKSGYANLRRTQSERSNSPLPDTENRYKAPLQRDLTPSQLFGMKGSGKDIRPQPAVMGSQALGELEEIREFAASKDFSVDEIRMLFKLWNEQHAMGTRSFKERQMALAEMRHHIQEREAGEKPKKSRFKTIFGGKGKAKRKHKVEISDPFQYRENVEALNEDRDSTASTSSSDRSSRGSKADSSISSDGGPDEQAPAPQLPPRSVGKDSCMDLYTKVNKKLHRIPPPPPPSKGRTSRAPPPIPPR